MGRFYIPTFIILELDFDWECLCFKLILFSYIIRILGSQALEFPFSKFLITRFLVALGLFLYSQYVLIYYSLKLQCLR